MPFSLVWCSGLVVCRRLMSCVVERFADFSLMKRGDYLKAAAIAWSVFPTPHDAALADRTDA